MSFLHGGGRSAELIRTFDWSSTPLGPLVGWPVALKTVVGMILGSAFPAAVTWGPHLTMIYNDPFRSILGDKPEAMGRPFADVWAEAWDKIGPIAAEAVAGKATLIEDFPLTIERGGQPEEAFFTFCYSPLRDDNGAISGMLDTVMETTARVQAERRFHLMNSELHHRIKNMFATVTSIASQTLRTERPLGELRALLLQRLGAIASAQSLLLDRTQENLSVETILETSLSPHLGGGSRINLQGPATLTLNDKQSLSLSLVINELVTNSIKYGALSNEFGKVGIVWEGASGGRFFLAWRENGGPAVAPPSRRGFGTTLMERVAPHDFGGMGTLSYAEQGLSYLLQTDRLPV